MLVHESIIAANWLKAEGDLQVLFRFENLNDNQLADILIIIDGRVPKGTKEQNHKATACFEK